MWFQKKQQQPTPEVDPTVQLQAEIDAQTEKLHQASSAVATAEELMRVHEREKQAIQSDIDRINHRLSIATTDSDLHNKLAKKTKELADREQAYQSAKADYDLAQQHLDEFNSAIRQTKENAATLSVQLYLANANAAGAAFQAQLQGAGSGTVVDVTTALKEKIRNANAHATVDRNLSSNPDAAREAEYLK